MIKDFVRLFARPSAEVMAREELEDAHRQFLRAQSGLDYARRMVEYQSDRITRLSRYVRETSARQSAEES